MIYLKNGQLYWIEDYILFWIKKDSVRPEIMKEKFGHNIYIITCAALNLWVYLNNNKENITINIEQIRSNQVSCHMEKALWAEAPEYIGDQYFTESKQNIWR